MFHTHTSIAESGYEGWVAWLDGTPVRNPAGDLTGYDDATPIFERIPHNPHLANLALGAGVERIFRGGGRKTMHWGDVPQERVNWLEIYGFRYAYSQPICQLMRQPGRSMRWIQFKKGALILQTLVCAVDEEGTGVERTGLTSWVIGFWDRTVGQAKLLEFRRDGSKSVLAYEGSNHPCWPKPLGFGLGPHVLGLTADQVPPVPEEFRNSRLPVGAYG